MARSRCVRLLLPGLLGPISDPDTVARIAPSLPALARFLRLASMAGGAASDGEGCLCSAFGLEGPPWPVAAASRHGEADAPPEPDAGWWLRLDPVHLRVDSNHARLFGPYVLDLSNEETASLTERLNEHLAADGLRIEAPAPDRWYVRLTQPPDFATYPLPEVAGRNVNPFMPTGGAAGRLRGWLTELQMLLHEAPANQTRERAGRLPANSVWPWGESQVPAPTTAPAHVLADDALACGLAHLAGLEPQALPAEVPSDWAKGLTLVADMRARDPLVHGEIEGWLEALTRFEADWVAPLMERLGEGAIDRLELEAGDGRRFALTRAGRYRLWRRAHPWHHWLAQG